MQPTKKKRKKSGGRDFQPGQSGNPGGKRPMDPALKELKHLSYQDFLASLHRYGYMTASQTELEVNRPDLTHFERLSLNVVVTAANGDKDARNVLLERLWGKVKDTIDIAHRDLDQELEKVNRDKIVQLLKEAATANGA